MSRHNSLLRLVSVHQKNREMSNEVRSAPSPRPFPQLGGEGKGEGESQNVKEFIALVLVGGGDVEKK